jgi:hypothetical protein
MKTVKKYKSLQEFYSDNWYPGCASIDSFYKNIRKGCSPQKAIDKAVINPLNIGNRYFRNLLQAHSYLKEQYPDFYCYTNFYALIKQGKTIEAIIQRYKDRKEGINAYGFRL